MNICSFWPELCLHQGSDLFTPRLWSSIQTATEGWGRALNQTSSLSLSLLDDFANGADWICPFFPRLASSFSSTHHNNTFLPLMTHWAWLYNNNRHIASTQMWACLCGASEAWISNIDFFQFSTCSLQKIMDSNEHKQTSRAIPLQIPSEVRPLTCQWFHRNSYVITPVLLLISDKLTYRSSRNPDSARLLCMFLLLRRKQEGEETASLFWDLL